MATATLPPTTSDRASVLNPLERLRGIIRTYVLLEGLASVGIFLALWFWIGIAADFGSFKALDFDWVQGFPMWLRAGFLIAMLAALAILIARRLVRRLTVDFSPAALALVLERKFQDQLGDRLITAVELGDLNRAAAQGYSRAMVEETVREAAERVATVPFAEVLDWSRLRRLGFWVAILWLAPLICFGAPYSALKRTNPVDDFLPRFRDVSTTWARRNLLLQDVVWPRKAYLELLEFPASGELRVGRDAPAPRVRLRARRWMLADASAADGWRPMTWRDLTPQLLGADVVTESPADLLFGARSVAACVGVGTSPGASLQVLTSLLRLSPEPGWEPTLDRIEAELSKEATRAYLLEHHPNRYEEAASVFDRLSLRAAEPAMRGVFRRLEVPDRVELRYWGKQTSSTTDLERTSDWEYVGALSDLKESVEFWARAADYYTPTKKVTVVPPPSLLYIERTEYRPAYLYHRPPLGDPPLGGTIALRALKQKLVRRDGSLNGAVTRFSVPMGTDVELRGELDKPLREARCAAPGKGVEGVGAEMELDAEATRFAHRIFNVSAPIDVELYFVDTDGVTSYRRVQIDPFADRPPRVNVEIEGIRRMKEGHFVVTPSAMIPFVGDVVDAGEGELGGLDRVDYVVTVNRVEGPGEAAAKTEAIAAATLPTIGAPVATRLANIAATGLLAPTQSAKYLPLDSFQQLLREQAARDVPRAELLNRLENEPGTPALVGKLIVRPQFEFLDLRDRLPDLRVKEEFAVQPRYRLNLTVAAVDNNILTGPSRSENKEPPFTVLVVSEPELLVEIAKEEETQHLKTEDAVARLREARQKLDKVVEQLPGTADEQLSTLGQRAQEVQDGVAKARDVVQDVFNDYSRLLRELKLNRVSPRLITKVEGEICMPLEAILKGEFVRAEEATEAYRKELDSGRRPGPAPTGLARQRLDELIRRLDQVMAAMGEVTTINKLVATLREIEKQQEESIAPRLKELRRLQEEKIRKDLEKIQGLEEKK